jgi:hypothetical protein
LKIIWEAIEQEQAGKEKAITEIKSGKATLKNLKSGQEISVGMESLVDEIKKLL